VIDRRIPARRPLACLGGAVLLVLTLGSLAVRNLYGAGDTEPPPRVDPSKAPEADRARVRFAGKVPVIRLSGTPYEMGRQHGALLAAQLAYLYDEYFEAMIVKAVGRAELEKWAREVEPHIPAALKEEMRGIADGSGRTYKSVLLANTMVDRFQTQLCSTIVAAGDATKDGGVLFGRNLDFPGRGILHRMTVVIVFAPDGGEPVAAVTWPGLVGVLSGMNAHGVCGATMLIHGVERRPGMPYLLMYREALSRARKAEDVAAYFATVPRTCANNFMVVDPTGASEVVEFDPKTIARRTGERGCVCSTNHFRSETLHSVGWSSPGRSRYEKLAAYLERAHGSIDAAGVREALRDVAKPWVMNVQSMIFFPRERSLELAVGDSLPIAQHPFQEIDREMLFGGGETAK
jgi:predicted choloylglycine hydrolase